MTLHNKNKCLILGAGGYIGRSLCKSLRNEYNLVAYDKYFPEELKQWNNVELVYGNFVSEVDFGRLLLDVDYVIHLISTTLPIEGTGNIQRELDENIKPTTLLLEAIAKSSVQKIVFSSSGGTVYGETDGRINSTNSPHNPRNTYGLQKSIIEKIILFYAQQYSFRSGIMRITNPYGVGQDPHKPQGVIPILIRKLFLREPIDVYGETGTRDYLYMDDLVRAFQKVLSYTGGQSCFNIGTGDVHTVPELISRIERISGQKFCSINYHLARSSDVMHSLLNVDESFRELGWEPSVSLDVGIRIILDYYKHNLY
jgi:UDP-glucose 4-epimerase